MPLPTGFELEQPTASEGPKLPPGFQLETPTQSPPSLMNKASSFLRGAYDLTPTAIMAKNVQRGLDETGARLGGSTTDLMASMKAPPEVSAAVGTVAQELPGLLIGGGFGKAGAPALRSVATDLMTNALKPSKLARKSGDALEAAKTMLSEGANVTEGGVAKLKNRIGDLNDELQSALNSSPATVDKSAIASRLQDVISKIETSTFNPQERVKAVEKIYNEVVGNVSLGAQIPVALANRIKSGIYKELGDLKYSRMKTGTPVSDAEIAQAALARGAKEEISAKVPESVPLNEEMSRLINAKNMAENSVLSTANRNPGGLAWLTHDLPRFIAMVAAQHPASKSIIARALYGAGSDTAATAAGTMVGGVASAAKERK